MKVFSKQLSGLGNQLFQYAAGLYFAQKYNASLTVLQEPSVGVLSHGVYHRPFLLSHFRIPSETRLMHRVDALMLAREGRRGKVGSFLRRLAGVEIRHEPLDQRYRFVEDLGLSDGTRALFLSGYWQAHGFADAVASQLRDHLTLRAEPSGSNLAVLDAIKAAPVSVSLHVRRGDYTLAAEGNIALPMDYYRRAIASVSERFESATFFVFSDDIAFAKKNLPAGIRSVYVEGNDDFHSQEDLRLMSACQHHIIANSSFSWWGAWLNPNPNKMVIAPRHWHLSKQSAYPDLLPPAWFAIESLRDS